MPSRSYARERDAQVSPGFHPDLDSSPPEAHPEAPKMTQVGRDFLRLDRKGQSDSSVGPSAGAQTSTLQNASAMAQSLESSSTLKADVIALIERPELSIYDVLRHPHATYALQTKVLEILRDAGEDSRRLFDLDDLIRCQEVDLRSCVSVDRDDRYLVDLQTLCNVISSKLDQPCPQSQPVMVVPRCGTEGSFNLLDGLRLPSLHINATNEAFTSVFQRLTSSLLAGLDWNGVLVAGGMALATLMHVDPRTDAQAANHDIDIYLYGLSVQAASAKLDEIHRVWLQNLPPSMVGEKIVIRNTKTVTFLAGYPTRRLQVILKLSETPTDVLLGFDLDQCAIGFNGTSVMMLPRCARALETGYTIFCSDLVHGYSSQTRRSTQIGRVLKYATRGFGIKILPSYVRALDDSSRSAEGTWPSSDSTHPDTGLERLQDLSQHAEDYIQGVYDRYEREVAAGARVELKVAGRLSLGTFQEFLRYCKAWDLDRSNQAFSLEISWTGHFYADLGDSYDDPTLIDYRWDPTFRAQTLAASIEEANQVLTFRTIGSQLGRKPWDRTSLPKNRESVQMTVAAGMYENPGAVQRYLHGTDLQSVLERGLCIPVALPSALEATLSMRHDTRNAFRDFCPPSRVVTSITLGNLRIPSLAGRPSASLLDPSDYFFSQDEPRSLRWWVIDDQTMWGGTSRMHDDLAELLSIFATWLSWIGRRASAPKPSPELREREILAGVGFLQTATERKYARGSGAHHPSLMSGLPPDEECSFFQSWVIGPAFPLSIALLAPNRDT